MCSVVLVWNSDISRLKPVISEVIRSFVEGKAEFEIILALVDHSIESMNEMQELVADPKFPNIQVYFLESNTSINTAQYIALENTLGDCVLVFEPRTDGFGEIAQLARSGHSMITFKNMHQKSRTVGYRLLRTLFKSFSYLMGKKSFKTSASSVLLSRLALSSVLKHPLAKINWRTVASAAAFVKSEHKYRSVPSLDAPLRVRDALNSGLDLLNGQASLLLKIAARFCVFAAVLNVLYSVYVVATYLYRDNVVEGWASMSLQMSGMFFIVSFVLMFICEYLSQLPAYNGIFTKYQVSNELNSQHYVTKYDLNVENSKSYAE